MVHFIVEYLWYHFYGPCYGIYLWTQPSAGQQKDYEFKAALDTS